MSFYHHLSHQVEGGYEGTFDDFFNDWLNGNIAFGTWMDHVMSYVVGFASGNRVASQRNAVQLPDGRSMLLVSYQDMMDDLPRVVRDIQDFLNLTTITDEQIRDLLPTFEFTFMKQKHALR